MKWRMYLAPRIGTGTRQDPYRTLLSSFINTNIGEGYHDCWLKAKNLIWSLCWAEDATHTAIAADSSIVTLSPLFDTETGWVGWLEQDKTTLSADLLTQLENKAINTAWLSDLHTIRDLIRYIRKISFIEQKNTGEWETADSPGITAVFAGRLDLTVGDLTATQRNRAKNWLQARGVAIGWITNATTIREVVHFTIQNIGLPIVYFNGVEL